MEEKERDESWIEDFDSAVLVENRHCILVTWSDEDYRIIFEQIKHGIHWEQYRE